MLVHSREHPTRASTMRSRTFQPAGRPMVVLRFPDLVIRANLTRPANVIEYRSANPLTSLTTKATSIDASMKNNWRERLDRESVSVDIDLSSRVLLRDRPRTSANTRQRARRAINTRLPENRLSVHIDVRVYTRAHVYAYFLHNYRLLIPKLRRDDCVSAERAQHCVPAIG